MPKAEQLIWLGAAYHLALAVFHLAFWRLFRWRAELPRLGVLNRGVMQVMNLMLTYIFAAVAVLQLAFASELAQSRPGHAVLLTLAGAWLLRALLQPFFWPRTPLSWAFCAAFAAGSAVHLAAFWLARA